MGYKFSADTIGGWENHFKRMGRWKERVFAETENLSGNFHTALDFVLAYFVWAHSMRDWLINSGVPQNDLDQELRKFDQWTICRDIANRSRHLKLTRNPRDADWSIARELDFVSHLQGREEQRMFLVSVDKKYDVRLLVLRTNEMWEEVLVSLQK
ncbi:MAG: hypothetical protein AAGA72_15240 [Pseudomonadota bacterium]